MGMGTWNETVGRRSEWPWVVLNVRLATVVSCYAILREGTVRMIFWHLYS